MTNDSNPATAVPLIDRARIALAGARYDFWLDIHYTRRRDRRALRSELTANLTEAAADVGSGPALANIGSLRRLAAETTRPDPDQPRWYAGAVAGLNALFVLWFVFLLQALTYVEGVLDAGTDAEVGSALFPFLWSEVVVSSADADGFGFSLAPGPMPFVYAAAVGLIVARPWRAVGSRRTVSAAA